MFTAHQVEDSETTYRIPATRSSEVKARALAAYFAPDEVFWLPSQVKAGRAIATPYVKQTAIANRLDWVLGPDCWQERYDETAGGATRCILQVRYDFTDAAGWIERVGHGYGIGVAPADAFRSAAERFGVGRYLCDLARHVDYDESNAKFTEYPRLPQGCLPIAFRACGPERARELTGLIEGAFSKLKLPPEKIREATQIFILDAGGYKDVKEIPFMENRHAQAAITRVHAWITAIAESKSAGYDPVKDYACSPFYKDRKYVAPVSSTPITTPKENEKTDANKSQSQPAERPLPATGAELIARLEVKDKELANERRIRRGELKTHVIEMGAKLQLSPDITAWQGTALQKATQWATEFIQSAPAPGTIGEATEAEPSPFF